MAFTENFIEKFVFSPDNLSVTEFLSNYFIGLLGYIFPLFVLLGLGVSIYGWIGKGAKKEELKTIAVQVLASILVVSFLLFNPGRKTILTSYGTSHSYWIVDTLNDLLAIGSRFSDAFVYNLLFGNTYNSSERKLFEFDEEHMFKLVNYNSTPNGEDYVDGYFLSSLSSLIEKQAKDTAATNTALSAKMKSYFDEDLKKDEDSMKRISSFVNDPEYNQSALLFFKSLKKLKSNEERIIKDIMSEDKKGNTMKTNLNKFKEFIVNDDTIISEPSSVANSLYNFRFDDTFTAANGVKVDKKLVMNKPSFNNNSSIISMGKETQKINLSINGDDTINLSGNKIGNIIETANSSNKFYEGYHKTVEFMANSLENENSKKNILAIRDKYKDKVSTEKVLNEIYEKYGDSKNYPFVTAVKSGNAKPEELQRFLNFYYSVLENKYEKYIWEVKNEIGILKELKQDITADNLDLLLNYVSDNLQLDKNSQVDLKGVSENAIITMNTSENAKEQFAKVMGDLTNNSYNNSIGSTSNANKGGTKVQLKFLEQSYIFLKDIEDTFSFFGMDLVKFKEIENGAEINSFHWYNLGNYTMGLKTLYNINNDLNSKVAGLQGEATANYFLSKCLPVYKDIAYNKENKKSSVTMDNDRYSACFPKSQTRIKNSMANIAKTVATIGGIYAGVQASSLMPGKFWGNPWSMFLKIFGATAIASFVGFIIFAFVYTALLLIYFFIPVLFFYTSVMTWIFKASIHMVFFGFSIILFVFDHKKGQIQQATISFIMYTLMPVYIAFIFFLTINVSFIIGVTIEEIFPSFEDKTLTATDMRTLEKINVKKLEKDNQIRSDAESANLWKNINSYFDKGIENIDDFVESTGDVSENFMSQDLKKTIIYIILEWCIGIIKFLVLVGLEIMLYTNLWKVDKFVNEMIGSNISNEGFQPEKILSNFGVRRFM